MKKSELYKRFKLNPKKAKPGDLMKAASKRKSEGKGWPVMHKKHKKGMSFDTSNGSSPAGRMQGALSNFGRASMGNNGPVGGNNSTVPMAKKHMKRKTHKKSVERESPVGSLSASKMNAGGPNAKKLGNQAAEFTKGKKMKTHCKSCGKAHEKGKHMKKHEKNTKEALGKDAKLDRLFHVKEGSPRDEKMDRIEGIKDKKHAKRKSHKKNWIANAVKKPGALRAEMGVKKGHNIPAGKLASAANKGGKEGARARLAQTFKGFKHKKGKK